MLEGNKLLEVGIFLLKAVVSFFGSKRISLNKPALMGDKGILERNSKIPLKHRVSLEELSNPNTRQQVRFGICQGARCKDRRLLRG